MNDINPSRASALAQLQAMLFTSDALQIGATEARLDRLSRRLDKFDRRVTLNAIGSILTVADYHPNTSRLEMLAHLAALRCRGTVVPTTAQMREWLNEILAADAVCRAEDPSEDVFVANIVSGDGNSRVFEGVWEANGGYLQSCLWAIKECAAGGEDWAEHCRRQSAALLRLSDAIAQRAGLRRNEMSEGRPRAAFQLPTQTLHRYMQHTRFTLNDLESLGIEPFDLEPFNFNRIEQSVLRDEVLLWSSLERRPLLIDDNGVIAVLPTAFGAAIRRRAVELAVAHEKSALFERHLSEFQFSHRVLPALEGLAIRPLAAPDFDETTRLGEVVGTFDDGAYVHVILVQDSIVDFAANGFQSIHDATPAVNAAAMQQATKFAAEPGYRKGLTLVVYGGLGRGVKAGVAKLPDCWQFAGLGYEDLDLIGWDANSSGLRIFRMLEQEDALQDKGITLMNMNGFTNLYGYACESNFELVADQVSPPAMITIGSDYVSTLRKRVRRALDRHALKAYDGEYFLEIQRQSTEMFFKDLQDEPLYVSVTHAQNGAMLACVETTERVWWVDARKHAPTDGDTIAYRMWDLTKNWLAGTAELVEARVDGLPSGSIGIELEFPEIADLSFEYLNSGAAVAPPDVTITGNRIVVSCSNAYLKSFNQPENVGDRMMIRAIVEGATALAGLTIAEGAVTDLVDAVIPVGSARFLHVLNADLPSSMTLAGPLPRPRLLQEEVSAWTTLGLAHSLGADAVAGSVIGIDEAGVLAGKAVGHFWSLARARLEQIDRSSVIEKALLNHNAIDKDRMTWRHTAAALLHLHRDREDVIQTALDRESARALAGLASRVIVEMAVCTAPTTGGRICGRDDLDYLIACVSNLVDFANRKDEIHYGFVTQSVAVNPNGTFRFPPSFALDIQVPYVTAQGKKQFLHAADSYDAFYAAAETVDAEEYAEKANPDFEAAFASEYGTTALGLHGFLWRLTELAVDSGTSIIRAKRSALVAMAAQAANVDEAAALKIVENQSLKPRAKWDEMKLADAAPKDWWPWRYARRLSLIARPIVQLDLSDDPDCMIAIPIAEHAFDYALRAWKARLPDSFYRTSEMRSWIGSVIDRLGHAFNAKVGDRTKALGLSALPECQMTQLGGKAADGDVDVLAWDVANGAVYVMECKRLLVDRTVGDVAERLMEYAPDYHYPNGKRGPTRKHLDRFSIIQANLGILSKLVGIAMEDIQLKSCLVTSELVPMQFQKGTAAYFDIVTNYAALNFALARKGGKDISA